MPAYRKASANYCIGNDGKIGQSVLEEHRAWTSSSQWNDNQAITIEVSNSQRGGDWPISQAAYSAIIDLCVDICQRNGIKSVNYTDTKHGVLTEHRMFAATLCPGPYIHNLLADGKIATDINNRLKGGAVENYIYEGVDMFAVFNAKYYASRYPDLAAAGLTAPSQLWNHFTMFGMNEARQADPTFNVIQYRNQNPDLVQAFENDWEAYYKHYCMCGRQEILEGKRKPLT